MDSRSYQPITNGEPQITELIKPAKVDEKMNRLCLLIERKVVQSQATARMVQPKSKMNCH